MEIVRGAEQIVAAERRWEAAEKRRRQRGRELGRRPADRHWWEIDDPDRVQRRLESKGMVGEAQAIGAWQRGDSLSFDPFERILEDNELVSATTLFTGSVVARSIGRVLIRAPGGRVRGFGTGFLVSSRLLLTNHHVLESADEARPSTIEFFHWEDLTGRRGEPVEFGLEPDVFFETDGALDFTLVAAAGRSRGGQALGALGWSPLIERSGKSTIGEPVNIIQHPGGEPQQVVLRENTITDAVDDFLHYEADTRPGSSGSPVFNVDWELSALHHAGVPARNRAGRILLRDGRVWDGSRALRDQIRWKANEGVRISRIVDELRRRETRWNEERRDLFGRCFEARPRFDELVPGIASPVPARTGGGGGEAVGPQRDTLVLELPHRVSLAVRDDGRARIVVDEPERPTARASDAVRSDFSERIDRDYDNRPGYDPRFLGGGRFTVPLPSVIAQPDAAVLPYQHFTVVMNRARRLAWFSGVNIHGRLIDRIRRSDGHTNWTFDTRIPRAEQIGDDLYRNSPIDRGHLVRRLDPVWGLRHIAQRANADTFHFTNSAPQHEAFNEDDTAWAGLEDHLLDNLEQRDRKASVFCGPIFRSDDPLFHNVEGESTRVPRQFFKVLVYRKQNALRASAWLLSQANVLRTDLGLEEFGSDAFRTFRVPVADLEQRSGLDFGPLREADSFDELAPESSLLESTGSRLIEVEALEDVAF